MGLTTDPHDGCLHEILPNGQQQCYLILPDGQRGFDFRAPVARVEGCASCGSKAVVAQGKSYACSTCGRGMVTAAKSRLPNRKKKPLKKARR